MIQSVFFLELKANWTHTTEKTEGQSGTIRRCLSPSTAPWTELIHKMAEISMENCFHGNY